MSEDNQSTSQSLKHVAIIMDGNGRWAQMRRRNRTFGHIKGARVAKKIITYCSKRNISYLTLYAFSTENWMRPVDEVSFLMHLLRRYLKKETENLVRQNIRFETIGETERLPQDIISAIEHAKERTAHCTGLTVIFAISYGSRQEITRSVREICHQVQTGALNLEDITEETLSAQLWTQRFPNPDLVIRTSGEKRLSNFLLWQSAYAELYFSNILWPDFTEHDLEIAIEDFESRSRRFGKVSTEPATRVSVDTTSKESTKNEATSR